MKLRIQKSTMSVVDQQKVLSAAESICQKNDGAYENWATRMSKFMNAGKERKGPFYQVIVGDDFSVALRHRKTDFIILVGSRKLKIFVFRAAPAIIDVLGDADAGEINESPDIRWIETNMTSETKNVVISALSMKPKKEQDRATTIATHLKRQLSQKFPSESSSWQVVAGLKGQKFAVDAIGETGSYADLKVGNIRCVVFRAKYVQPFPLKIPSTLDLFKFAIYGVPLGLFASYVYLNQSCDMSCLSENATCTDDLKEEQEECQQMKAKMSKLSVYSMFMAFAARFAMRRFNI